MIHWGIVLLVVLALIGGYIAGAKEKQGTVTDLFIRMDEADRWRAGGEK